MVTNVKSKWVDGDLYFYDKSDAEICHFDGTNRALVLPSGAVFSCASLNLDTTELGLLDGVTAGDGRASKVLSLDAYKALRVGDWVAAGAKGSAVAFATAMNHYTDGQLGILSIFGGSEANLTSAYNVHVARFRHLVSGTTAAGTDAITAAQETYGVVGQLVAKYATMTHLHAGVLGTFEGNTAGVVLSSSYSVGHAAVMARIGGHAYITATTPLAGFLAFNNASAALASGSSYGFALSVASGTYPFTVGLCIPDSTATTGISIGTCTTSITAVSPATFTGIPAANGIIYANTTSALTTAGSVRAIVGAVQLAASTASGTLVGVRGAATAAASTSGVYVYGLQGKFVTGANTVAGVLAGVYAQFDMTGGTLGAGNIACLQANIVGCASGTVNLNGIYVESAGGGIINAFARFFGKSTYVFDFESNVHNQMSTTGTPGAVTGGTGWLKVLVEGAVRYIPLTDSVS